jgi:hypothetical protein
MDSSLKTDPDDCCSEMACFKTAENEMEGWAREPSRDLTK